MAKILKKKKNFSWDKTDKRLRKIIFKALQKDEKLGLELGLGDKCLDVVAVREGSPAYWKGVEKGYKMVSVNKVAVSVDTVKAALRNACTSGKDFTMVMRVPLTDDIKVDAEENNHLASSGSDECVVNLWYHIPDASEIKNNKSNRQQILASEKKVNNVEKNNDTAANIPEVVVNIWYNLQDDDYEIKNNIYNKPPISNRGSIPKKQLNDTGVRSGKNDDDKPYVSLRKLDLRA